MMAEYSDESTYRGKSEDALLDSIVDTDETVQDSDVVEILDQTRLSLDPVTDYLKMVRKAELLSAEQEVEYAKAIRVGNEARELLEGGPEISTDITDILHEAIKEGTRAKEALIMANMQLVVSRARAYNRFDLEFLDLAQAGTVGMIHAVRDFDHERGVKFSSFAVGRIDSAIQQESIKQRYQASVPREVGIADITLQKLHSEMTQELHREPTLDELTTYSHMSPSLVEGVMNIPRNVLSFDMPINERGDTLGQLLPGSRNVQSVEDETYEKYQSQQLEKKLSLLTDDERLVIYLNFGFDGGRPMTMAGIMNQLGISRYMVEHIRDKALSKLRHPSTGFDDVESIPGQEWRKDALCLEIGHSIFYPADERHRDEAVSVCDICDVREQCLAYALSNEEYVGIWAGTSGNGRREASDKKHTASPND